MDFWKLARARATGDEIEEALCAVWFNVQGYLHELIRARLKGFEPPATRIGVNPALRLRTRRHAEESLRAS